MGKLYFNEESFLGLLDKLGLNSDDVDLSLQSRREYALYECRKRHIHKLVTAFEHEFFMGRLRGQPLDEEKSLYNFHNVIVTDLLKIPSEYKTDTSYALIVKRKLLTMTICEFNDGDGDSWVWLKCGIHLTGHQDALKKFDSIICKGVAKYLTKEQWISPSQARMKLSMISEKSVSA